MSTPATVTFTDDAVLDDATGEGRLFGYSVKETAGTATLLTFRSGGASGNIIHYAQIPLSSTVNYQFEHPPRYTGTLHVTKEDGGGTIAGVAYVSNP